MALHIHQTCLPQTVDITYQDLNNRGLQKHHQMYAEPVIQQHQMYRDPGIPQQIYTEHIIPQQIYREEDLQQHTQIYRAEDIQQHTQIYCEAAPQPQASTLPTTQHVCDVCNKTCKSKSDLQAHYATHTGEKAHICDVCHKGFTQKSSLQTHYLIHTGDKPHVCEICKRGFTDKSTLRKHSLIHTGQKPHVCDICNRGFVQKGNLREHYFTHTGEKNHICEICEKGFTRRSNLRKHYKVHSADREAKRRNLKSRGKKVEEDKILLDTEPPSGDERVEFQPEQTKVEYFREEIKNAVVEQQQTETKHCDLPFFDNSSSFEGGQPLMRAEALVYLENPQAFATIEQPPTRMVHQALNLPQGIHSLMTVHQQSLPQLEHQSLTQIRRETFAQIGHQTFTIIG